MRKKQCIYMYQCVVCRENIYTEDMMLRHCGRLTQWVAGLEGKGIDMKSPMIKIQVSGEIEMSQEALNGLLAQNDPHKAIVDALHMGYIKSSGLEFELEYIRE